MYISIVANIVNVVGNCVGVFVLHLGVVGVVIPSLISIIFAIVLNMGVIGIVYAMCLDWAVRGIIFWLRFKGGKWKEYKVI